MTSPALRCQTTWTEDRATQRCDPSAVPGAETGAEARCDLRLAPFSPPLRDRHQSDKPSWQDAATFLAGCVSPLANARRSKFQFTVNQDTIEHKLNSGNCSGDVRKVGYVSVLIPKINRPLLGTYNN